MSDPAHGLLLKYGLRNRPSDEQVRDWAKITRKLRGEGLSLEQAGATAARQLFPDFKSTVFKAEADTIEALLRAAENK